MSEQVYQKRTDNNCLNCFVDVRECYELRDGIQCCGECDHRTFVAVEPEHQHQFLPWLTLPNGSSWTGCASCDWQYQFDH